MSSEYNLSDCVCHSLDLGLLIKDVAGRNVILMTIPLPGT